MAASPFSRAPGSQVRPSSSSPAPSPSLSLHSGPRFSAHDPFSSTATSVSPGDNFALSPDDVRDAFAPAPGGGARGPSNPSFGVVDHARPYPPVERRSFRDASSAGDVVVSREELANGGGGGGSGAIGEGRKATVGAIGDGRRLTPSPSPAGERREEEVALGLPAGIFDGHGQLAAPPSSIDDGRSDGAKSRPSSFILDILPQTRERGSTGATTPSLSLDSVSQAPSSSSIHDTPLLHSPNSLAPIAPPFFNSAAASSVASLALSQSGSNILSTSRTSSPAPLDNSGPISNPPSLDSLAAKVNTLESTVSDLSTLLATEFRNLRDEVGLLRSLVLQQQQQQPPQQQQQSVPPMPMSSVPRHPFDPRPPLERGETDSPMLTLRSPSPHHSPAFPQPIPLPLGSRPPFSNPGMNGSAASLLAQPASSPAPLSPHSAPGGFFAERHLQQDRLRTSSDESSVKDEQIKLLTAQVNSLSTTVSHLLSNNSNSAASGNAAGAQSPHLNGPASAPIGRGMSLPIPSPSLGSFNDGSGQGGWKRDLANGATGLGVSAPGGLLGGGGGPGGVKSPLMRPVSTGGLARSGSLRSASAGTGGGGLRLGGEGSFETLSSNSAWDGGVSSPMLGNGGGSAVGSPMLGNPPGSLGSKWEVLGIGNDLFRAIAKYGLGPPTKIQSKSIPCVVRGQDVVAQAPAIQERIQSYVIPALQLIFTHASLAAQQAALEGTQPGPRGIQAIVITATVDQAAQAQRLSVGLGGSLGIRTSLCVGASSASDLQNELQTLLKAPPHILVGTPQKLLDLFSMRALPTHDVRLLVIDECDQLIARNLAEHVLNLARLLPPPSSAAPPSSGSPVLPRSPLPGAFDSPAFSTPMARFGSNISNGGGAGGAGAGAGAVERQMAIFSCTVPQDVLNFASSLQLREPVRVLVRRDNGGDGASPSMRGLRQYYLYLAVGSAGNKSKAVGAGRREAGTAREWKLEALADLCEDHSFDHAVIFASSLDNVEAIQYKLGSRAIEAYALHQDMGQPARQQILTKFRSTAPSLHQRPGMGSKRVLIVYDALSRSLSGEVNQVPLVINFDLPRAVEDYIHRISCASTSGYGKNSSMVLNIVTPNDVDMLRGIESFYRCKIQELPPNFATSS
ncbi:hypothetical protein JCM5296_006967 [Sporobolomyces johnsonii]